MLLNVIDCPLFKLNSTSKVLELSVPRWKVIPEISSFLINNVGLWRYKNPFSRGYNKPVAVLCEQINDDERLNLKYLIGFKLKDTIYIGCLKLAFCSKLRWWWRGKYRNSSQWRRDRQLGICFGVKTGFGRWELYLTYCGWVGWFWGYISFLLKVRLCFRLLSRWKTR